MPLASNGDTPYQPIADIWKEVTRIIQDHEFWYPRGNKVNVSVDASDLIDVFEACITHDRDDGERLRSHMRRWVENDEFSYLRIVVDGEKSLVSDDHFMDKIIQALVEEIFLALSLSVAGAARFNGGVCKELDRAYVNYYGDSIEAAWWKAKGWGWPILENIPFEKTWTWLQQIGFRDCWLADEPSHKALIAFLECGKNKSEIEDVLLIARSIEAFIGGEGISIGRTLKNRISKILGVPDTHKNWLSEFYNLRSRVAHGSFPMIRSGVADDDDAAQYSSKLWQPLDQSRAVVLGMLQNLVLNKSDAFDFDENLRYPSIGSH